MIYPQLELVIRMFRSKYAYFTNMVDYESFPCPKFRLRDVLQTQMCMYSCRSVSQNNV